MSLTQKFRCCPKFTDMCKSLQILFDSCRAIQNLVEPNETFTSQVNQLPLGAKYIDVRDKSEFRVRMRNILEQLD